VIRNQDGFSLWMASSYASGDDQVLRMGLGDDRADPEIPVTASLFDSWCADSKGFIRLTGSIPPNSRRVREV
jgi:hypothetical protein